MFQRVSECQLRSADFKRILGRSKGIQEVSGVFQRVLGGFRSVPEIFKGFQEHFRKLYGGWEVPLGFMEVSKAYLISLKCLETPL